MKTFILLLLLPVFGAAQSDSCDLKVTTDKFTGVVEVDGGMFTFSLNPISIFQSNKNTGFTTLYFSTDRILCADKSSEIFFLFTDSSRLVIKNSTELNCEGSFSVYLANKDPMLRQLELKTIASIRLMGRDGFEDLDINTENADKIQQVVHCLNSYSF